MADSEFAGAVIRYRRFPCILKSLGKSFFSLKFRDQESLGKSLWSWKDILENYASASLALNLVSWFSAKQQKLLPPDVIF